MNNIQDLSLCQQITKCQKKCCIRNKILVVESLGNKLTDEFLLLSRLCQKLKEPSGHSLLHENRQQQNCKRLSTVVIKMTAKRSTI